MLPWSGLPLWILGLTMPEETRRIGVFGGTFDPIHNAHLAIARLALESAGLDEVLFVVSARPPHKTAGPHATPALRYAMVKAALDDEPCMRASKIELGRPGPSYMADTLEALREREPGARLYLIVGMDSLIDLPGWKSPDRLLDAARILAVPRPGHWEVPSSLAGHYEVLPFRETPVSSTEIRARIASGQSCDGLVPAKVLALIREQGAYREPCSQE